MASMLEDLAGTLGGDTLGQLAGAFGTNTDVMGKAVAAALPALIGGLARNSREPSGAESLFNAVSRDHDGSILDSLGAIFGGSKWAQQQSMSTGERILGHVFGGATPRVEEQVAQSSGLDLSIVKKLLPILAPIVMGYIGKRMRGDGLDGGGLAASLEQEREVVKKSDGGLGGLLDLLDGDGNGGGGLMSAATDLLGGAAGRSILGKLLGG